MDGKVLVLEGLPDQAASLKAKIELYFKNRRKSGGEVLEIQEHPNDRKKALLVYAIDEDASKVLEKKIHKVDFKGLGKVDLIVKPHGEKVNTGIEKESCTPSPSLIKEKQEHCREALVKQEQVNVDQKSSQQGDSGMVTLLVRSTQSIDDDLLTLYFEQFSDDVSIKQHGENGWILRLSNQSDTEKVLGKEEHTIGPCSFSVVLYDERAELEKLDPRRFILSGFAGSCKHRVISVYIKSCSKGAEHSWETLSEPGSLAVTFKQDIDIKSFLEKCSMKKLEDMEITASRMMRTDTVLVEGKMDSISEEALMLYFSSKRSKGGEISSLNWVDRTKSVTVTFRDWRVAHSVAEQAHSLGGVRLQAVVFYTHLQKALTGETAPPPTAPSKITLHYDSVLLSHLSHNKKFLEQFEKTLQDVHARVSVNKTEQSKISLEMTVDQESLLMYYVASVWESKARTDVESLLKKYIAIKLDAENEIWKKIKDTCLSLVTADVSVFYEGPHHRILVVGQKNEANQVVDSVRLLVKNTSEELAIQRNTVVRMIPLNSKEELDFLWNMVSSKVDGVQISKDDEKLSIHLKGLTDPVSSAEMIIRKEKGNLATKTLNLSVHLAKFLKSLDLKKFEHDHFVQQKSQEGISAVILRRGDSYQILAEKKDIFKAEQTVMAVLKEEALELTPEQVKVTKDENWRHFFGDLTEDVSNVKVLQSHKSIIMTGFCSAVTDVSRKLKGYLNNKKPVTDDVTVESVEVLNFINDCMNLLEVPAIKVLNAIIVPSKTSLCLKVTAASDKIQEAISTVKKQLALIVREKHTFLKAGEFMVLEKNQNALKAQAKEFGCMLHFPTKETSHATSARSYSYNITSSITLTIVQGDVSCHSGDVLVCPLSGNLAFDDPIAQQLLKKGGPQIQEALKSLTKERNSLVAGDVVLSKPGNLSAKILMYAGISAWGSSGHQLNGQTIEFIHLKSAILKCLTNAQEKKFTSMVMPALGCGTFGYPVSESCKAVIGAILEFCETYQGAPQDLRKILIFDPDIKIVEEFNNVANEIVGKQAHSGTTMGKDTRPSNKANLTQPPQVPPKSGAVSRMLVGSMLVMLKKGDITQEKVDAIVNSTNSTLNLQTGVSGAILKAAGKSVTDECAKLGTQKEDGVVVTSGGSLSCKHIIQMVGPITTAGITASIEKVLQLCESKTCAKVSIPAIGTGKGNIGPKESLEAILKGLENHSSKTASTCIQFVYIVALEDRVFQCLYEYFVEKTHLSLPKKQSNEEQLPANEVKIREVRLEVRKGNIVTETVRGIVNTTNKDVSLKGGVSGAILKAAGQSVEEECKKLSPLDDDSVGITGGGALQCDFIIHMLGPHSCAAVTSRVERVLEQCENNQITTVSFPAVGTGGGGLKAADSITAMLKGFENHLTRRVSTVLKLVYIVIDKDDVLKDVLHGLQLWKTKSTNESDEEEEEDWSSESEEEDQGSSSSSIKVVMGPIDVEAVCGDITKETTDAIVNSTNTSLNLNTGVSGAILKAAGNSVVDECKALGSQPSDGLVVTKPGRLPVKHIVHMVGQTTDKTITSSMCKVLKACNDIKVQSVSFPALGTGAGSLHADQVAVAMMDAIQNFLQDNPQPSVTSIHIVIFQQNMFSSFEQVMKKCKVSSAKNLVKSQPGPRKSQCHPSLDLTSLLASVTYPTMTVEVYGTAAVSLAQVKKCLEDLLAEECSSQDVEAQSLCFLQEAEKQTIIDLSNKHHLCVTVQVNKLTVSGKKDDVLMAVLKIKDILQGAKERENQKFEEERIKKTVLWEKVKRGSWTSIKSNISYNLECAYIRQEKTYLFTHKGKTCKLDLEQMQMTNDKGITFKIRRTPLVRDSDTAVIQTPPTWTKMGGKNYIIVPLVATSQEYQNISKDFIASCEHFTKTQKKRIEVVQIERLQHDELWQSYSVRKQAIDKKYPKNSNEQMLYHGTTKEICQKINACGFNRSFCGRNATKYGLGTYFAKQAYYSCYDEYSSPDDQGQKYIYRARVLTGKPCLGESELKEPKALNPNDTQAGLHDCAVDNLQKPFIFVIFCDSGAYPEYLITFKAV